MDDLPFLVKKYMVFLSYFMYMYPLRKNGRTLVTSLDRCRCGNSQRMLSYLFNFRNKDQLSIKTPADLKRIGSVSKYIFGKLADANADADTEGEPLLVKVHLGVIDHTFIINIHKGEVQLYQSYIDVNPLIVTKLSNKSVHRLFTLLDKISNMSADVNRVHIDYHLMETMVQLFGVPTSHIKFEFDDHIILNTKVMDRKEFYHKLVHICSLYYEKFVRIGTLVTFQYLKEDTVEHLRRKIKQKNTRTDDKLVEQFDGEMLYYEFCALVNELVTVKGLHTDDVETLAQLQKAITPTGSTQRPAVLNGIPVWGTVVADFIKSGTEMETVSTAAKLGLLNKMDPSAVLTGELDKELEHAKREHKGGYQTYQQMRRKYKQRYVALHGQQII